jgi:hypothetical protein
VDDIGLFYQRQSLSAGTHLVLRLSGKNRFIVPRNAVAQRVCWQTFLPGRVELPLRVVAHLPRLFGAVCCIESGKLNLIRQSMGVESGLSCCRNGPPGPWSKDTILLLHKDTAKPVYIVKAGAGEAVDRLLRNEVAWLRTLREQPSLVDHIPEVVSAKFGTELSFVAQHIVSGRLDLHFDKQHAEFLNKLHDYSRQTMLFEQSRLYLNLCMRLESLSGLLSSTWSTRFKTGMRLLENKFCGTSIMLVAAHNDFTPWNIRVDHGIVRVFDWEYADQQQLPLFDLLHFALMPMALRERPTSEIVRCLGQTLQKAQLWFGEELYREAQSQALAYLMNLCTLYLWADRGDCTRHPVLVSYAHLIDYSLRDLLGA